MVCVPTCGAMDSRAIHPLLLAPVVVRTPVYVVGWRSIKP